MRFSQRLKKIRKDLHLRQDDLARACGVKLTAISKYENEIIKPAFEMLSKIGLAYNINLNWLVNEIGSMFIETPSRRLIKTGTNDFAVEEVMEEISSVDTGETTHGMDLQGDLKVEYYGIEGENYTKIYHKDGNVEYQASGAHVANFQELVSEISAISSDKAKYDFVATAIKALHDKKALSELEILIKGMKLSSDSKK